VDTGDYVSVGCYPFQLRPATSGDLNGIFRLLDGAAAWLRTTKDTDQWERPWPTREARDARVRVGVENGETWIVLDGYVPMGTVTIARKPNIDVWSNLDPGCRLSDRAVYVHRLITARNYAGLEGLGSELLNWAGRQGQRLYGAQWIRIDVWASNLALHNYYMKRGFRPCGRCADRHYPSGALFQKPVAPITQPSFPWFVESIAAPLPRLAAPRSRLLSLAGH
jgi:ribosomal protein S18 acetylase RimI-like enzyme